MRRYLGLSFSVGIGIALLSTTFGARADIIYTYASTGTINGGWDNGLFGGIGSLAGLTYSITESFDLSLSTFNSSSSGQSLNPAFASAVVTVNNHAYTFNGNLSINNFLTLTSPIGIGGGEAIIAQVYDVDGLSFIDSSIYSDVFKFISSADLSQTYYYAVPNDFPEVNSGIPAGFKGPDGTQFGGLMTSVSLNGGTAPVPEPRSLALFGVGLAGIGLARARTRARAATSGK